MFQEISNVNAQKDFLLVQTVELVQIQFKDLAMPCTDKVNVLTLLEKWSANLHVAVELLSLVFPKVGGSLVKFVQ